jgi:hypothetical protein
MKKIKTTLFSALLILVSFMILCGIPTVSAKIITVMGPTFNLAASEEFISTPDGGAYLMWDTG